MAVKLSERRSELDKYLRSIVKQRCGSENVYYQPPAVIDPKPDSEMTAAVSLLEKSTHDRHFVSDNLYHDVFSVWY